MDLNGFQDIEQIYEVNGVEHGGASPGTPVSDILRLERNMDIWASSRENLSSGGCEQHRRRPACASAQSDQRLCYLRFVKNHI